MTTPDQAGRAYIAVLRVLTGAARDERVPEGLREDFARAIHHFHADRSIVEVLWPEHAGHGLHRGAHLPTDRWELDIECGCGKTLVLLRPQRTERP